MSWLRVDDGFPESAKAIGLSDAALAMWLRVACWSQREGNRHLAGFIPAETLPGIAKLSPAKARGLAKKLVEAKGGKDFGLWEERDGGWQIHDWDKYQPPPQKMSRSESARIAGQRSAEARRTKNGTAQPTSPKRTSNETESFGAPFGERRSEGRSPNEPSNVRTPDPDPVGSSGSAREPDEVFIRCPADLELSPDQVTNLKFSGMTQEFIDQATPRLRAKFVTQNPRTRGQWLSSLASALNRSWTDPAKRDELLGKAPPPKIRGKGPIQPNTNLSTDDFLAKLGHGKTSK